MTYSTGQKILASDYNGFVSDNSANVNSWWAAGASDSGWGQTSLTTVSKGSKIYASSWSSLINTLQTAHNHTGVVITNRTAPNAGDKISVFTALDTDITNLKNGRGNAVASGSTSSTWSGSAAYTSNVNSGTYNWTLTWTNTVTFDSADQARYFFNAGGLIRIDMSKTSTGTTKDTYWNSLVSSVGTLYISGGVNTTQNIAGVSYTGFTVRNGSGSPSVNTGYGWYYLLNNPGSRTAYQINQSSGLYTGDYIRVALAATSSSQLTVTVTWYSPGLFLLADNGITGGTSTSSPFSGFGSAPAVVVRTVAPSTAYLSNSWGTQSISESVALATSPGPTVNYIIVGGGGGGASGAGYEGGGGGGAGGMLVYNNVSLAPAASYSVVVGLGGQGTVGGSGLNNSISGGNSSFNGITAYGGGFGGGNTNVGYNPTGGGGGSGGGGNGSGTGHSGGAGIAGQGHDGGPGYHYGDGGGGGGAYSGGDSRTAGIGLSSSITGSPVTYATGGTGGVAYGGAVNGASGAPNTGNGGSGGGGYNGAATGLGGNGGSGVVIISYDSASQLAYGGTVTHYSGGVSGTIWVHTFTSSGSFGLTP